MNKYFTPGTTQSDLFKTRIMTTLTILNQVLPVITEIKHIIGILDLYFLELNKTLNAE